MNTGKRGEGRSPEQSRSLSLSLSRLRGVQRRFEQWRRERKGRARIPEALWRAAVTMAEIYGVNRTATALRLDYYTLKKRLEAKANAGRGCSRRGSYRRVKAESGPVMEELHAWLWQQFDDRLVEPNSSLGGAITYMRKHWKKLTLFLRVPGAPLDNNICERALKMAIRHRRNSLFFKTQHGAEVG